MYKIEIYKGKTPKWYNENTRSIKCCFCDDFYTLEDGDSPARHGQYICPECEERLKKKYEFTWDNFRAINNPNNIDLYRPGLVESLYEKYKILNEKFLYELNREFAEPCPICHKYHTSRDRVSIFNICRNCVKTLPGWTEWKENHEKTGSMKLVIDVCEKHGFYVSTQLNKNHRSCPECVKEAKTVKCEICGNKYISEDKHLSRIKNGETHNICPDCQSILPGFDNWQKNKNICWCNNCKQYVMVSHNFDNCPECGGRLTTYQITCKKCGKENCIVDNPAKIYCDECQEELSKSEAVKEFESLKANSLSKIINDIIMLPIRSFIDREHYKFNVAKICKHCGRPYIGHNVRQDYCGDCWHIVECENCGREYMVTPSKYYSHINDKEISPDGKWHGTCSLSCRTSNSNKNLWRKKGKCNAPGSKTPIYDDITYKNVQYKNRMIEINENNIEQYIGKPGVWYRIDTETNEVLQVSETMNIFKEWIAVQDIINRIICGTYNYHCSYVQMSKDGIDLSKTKTFIIDICEDRKRRFDIEASFAIENDAKYWKPAPGYQIKMIYGKE